MVEGNHYFPPDSLKVECFEPSQTTTRCGWKGIANYYTIHVDGRKNVDAAWYYAEPKEKAASIRGFVAFWKGVAIEETPGQTTGDALKPGGSCDV